MGHRQRSDRLVKSAALLAEYPGQAICGNGRSDRAAVDGFYRFIEKAAVHGIDVDAILAPHRERSIQRMRSQRTVLAIQDGTDLNFARRPGCEGLGVIGHNQTRAKTPGLHLHATLAVTDSCLPLGVLRCEFEALPDPAVEPGVADQAMGLAGTAPLVGVRLGGLDELEWSPAMFGECSPWGRPGQGIFKNSGPIFGALKVV